MLTANLLSEVESDFATVNEIDNDTEYSACVALCTGNVRSESESSITSTIIVIVWDTTMRELLPGLANNSSLRRPENVSSVRNAIARADDTDPTEP